MLALLCSFLKGVGAGKITATSGFSSLYLKMTGAVQYHVLGYILGRRDHHHVVGARDTYKYCIALAGVTA